MGEIRSACKILVERPEGKRPCRCEDNIRMDLREVGWEIMDWMHLAFVNMVMNFPVPHKAGNLTA
jgi:hypothetical protein